MKRPHLNQSVVIILFAMKLPTRWMASFKGAEPEVLSLTVCSNQQWISAGQDFNALDLASGCGQSSVG